MSKFGKDFWERVLVTFVQGFIAGVGIAIIVPAGTIDLDTGQTLVVALVSGGIAGGLAAVKAFIAKNVGNSDSASLNPDV